MIIRKIRGLFFIVTPVLLWVLTTQLSNSDGIAWYTPNGFIITLIVMLVPILLLFQGYMLYDYAIYNETLLIIGSIVNYNAFLNYGYTPDIKVIIYIYIFSSVIGHILGLMNSKSK